MTPLPAEWVPLLRDLVNAGEKAQGYVWGFYLDADSEAKRKEAQVCMAEWDEALGKMRKEQDGPR